MRNSLYEKAYKQLNGVNILKFDCGRLCDKRCCRSGFCENSNSGMQLLPGEADYIRWRAGFEIAENENGIFLLCDGNCERDFRPFACRIFPFYVKITQDKGRIRISLPPDIRARGFCPIISKGSFLRKNIKFARAAKRAVKILIKDEEIKKELIALCAFIDDIRLLHDKLK